MNVLFKGGGFAGFQI